MKVSYKTFWIIICQYSIALGFFYDCVQPFIRNWIDIEPVDYEYLLWGFVVCSGGKIAKNYFNKNKLDNNQE